MRSYIVLVFIIALILVVSGKPHTTSSRLVGDVSWPNCTLSLQAAQTGIVGINYGRAFTPNPCLVQESLNFKFLSVYVNTAYPGIAYGRKYALAPRSCSNDDNSCLAYNYGYNAGLYDINYALHLSIVANRWWLDVETENSWDNNTKINRSALQGTLDAISRFASSSRVGIYSSPNQWDLLTGSWHNGYPEWLATGSTNENVAKAACRGKSFTGGEILLAQFTPSLDQNYMCNGWL